jgi:hypothetical protein
MVRILLRVCHFFSASISFLPLFFATKKNRPLFPYWSPQCFIFDVLLIIHNIPLSLSLPKFSQFYPKETKSLLRFLLKEIKEIYPEQQFGRSDRPQAGQTSRPSFFLHVRDPGSWPGMTGPQAGHTGQLTVPHRQQFQRIWPV